MGNITSTAELKNAILILELEQAIKGQLLKEQFFLITERLKFRNILKNSINSISSSPHLIDNALGTAVGLATGYLSRKIIVGVHGNRLRKLFGYILQFGVTNIVAQHTETIKSLGQFVFQHFSQKKEMNPD